MPESVQMCHIQPKVISEEMGFKKVECIRTRLCRKRMASREIGNTAIVPKTSQRPAKVVVRSHDRRRMLVPAVLLFLGWRRFIP